MIVPTYETTAREQEIIINNQRKEIERLNKENEQLITALNTKESIIKEVREYINDSLNNLMCDERGVLKNCMKLLKGDNKD